MNMHRFKEFLYTVLFWLTLIIFFVVAGGLILLDIVGNMAQNATFIMIAKKLLSW